MKNIQLKVREFDLAAIKIHPGLIPIYVTVEIGQCCEPKLKYLRAEVTAATITNYTRDGPMNSLTDAGFVVLIWQFACYSSTTS